MPVTPKPFAEAPQRPGKPEAKPKRKQRESPRHAEIRRAGKGREEVDDHVQILHQPPHRGHGDLHPHGHRRSWPCQACPRRSSEHRPAEMQVKGTYPGPTRSPWSSRWPRPSSSRCRALTTMNYMYSLNANDGSMKLTVNFDIKTDPNTDQILSQMRSNQANSQLPSDVINQASRWPSRRRAADHVRPLSPNGTYDNVFLANYCYINVNDQMTRVPESQRHRLRRRAVRHAPVGEARLLPPWASPSLRSSLPSAAKHGQPLRQVAASRYRRARSSPMPFAPRAPRKRKGVRQHRDPRRRRRILVASKTWVASSWGPSLTA